MFQMNESYVPCPACGMIGPHVCTAKAERALLRAEEREFWEKAALAYIGTTADVAYRADLLTEEWKRRYACAVGTGFWKEETTEAESGK